MKRLIALGLLLSLIPAVASAQFSGAGPGFRISPGLYGAGDGRTQPVNLAVPTISGGASVGNVLTATTGTWSGVPVPTYTYAWKRNGSAIGGATASTYTLVTADNGTTTTVTVTATNIAGAASATSAGTGPITDPAGDFIARTSGLDATHQNAFTALINGMVADGIWTKFDALYIYATQGSANALLNLVSATYNSVSHGSPTFTTDRGYTGTASSSTIYIDTTFTPSTASSPNFVRNSGHVSVWSLTSGTIPGSPSGADDGTNSTIVAPRLNGGSGFFRLNETVAGGSDNVVVADGSGHFIVSRTGASVVPAYRNATVILNGTMASVAVGTKPFYSVAWNNNGTPAGQAIQFAMFSIGGGLTALEITSFYNRLRTYMTVVGVP